MASEREKLNERVRQSISGLSDEELENVIVSIQSYTPFARLAAQQELSRRKRSTAKKDSQAQDRDPSAFREEAAAANRTDCYIEIWSSSNFEGDYIRIEGPIECTALNFSGVDWSDIASSLRVGPHAFVLAYSERGFKGNMISFGPGQELSSLEPIEWDNKIDSISVVNSLRVFDEWRLKDVKRLLEESPTATKTSQ